MESRELVIVGCGPAGSTAAREAARAGVSTLVLERDAIVGRKRVCAAGLRPGFCGTFNLPRSLVHCDTPRLALFDGDGVEHELNFGPGHTSTREELDGTMAEKAVGEGAEIRTQALFREIRRERRHTLVEYADLRTGQRRTVAAAHVFFAPGATAQLDALASRADDDLTVPRLPRSSGRRDSLSDAGASLLRRSRRTADHRVDVSQTRPFGDWTRRHGEDRRCHAARRAQRVHDAGPSAPVRRCRGRRRQDRGPFVVCRYASPTRCRRRYLGRRHGGRLGRRDQRRGNFRSRDERTLCRRRGRCRPRRAGARRRALRFASERALPPAARSPRAAHALLRRATAPLLAALYAACEDSATRRSIAPRRLRANDGRSHVSLPTSITLWNSHHCLPRLAQRYPAKRSFTSTCTWSSTLRAGSRSGCR